MRVVGQHQLVRLAVSRPLGVQVQTVPLQMFLHNEPTTVAAMNLHLIRWPRFFLRQLQVQANYLESLTLGFLHFFAAYFAFTRVGAPATCFVAFLKSLTGLVEPGLPERLLTVCF